MVGKGACRGDGWSVGEWPLGAGVQSKDDCEDLCQDKQVGTVALNRFFFIYFEGRYSLEKIFLFTHTLIVDRNRRGGGVRFLYKMLLPPPLEVAGGGRRALHNLI